ncbi:23836_t:CDS:1, partial [Racocetra persica]
MVGALAPTITVWIEHRLKKRKYNAETKEVELKNKITQDITYEQLKKDNLRKNISGSVKLFREISNLEDELEKEQNPETRRRRLELLAKLEKAFGQTLGKETEPQGEEKPRLTTKEKKEKE